MSKIGFIFDLDGTLFRVETVTIPAVKAAFKRCGLPSLSSGLILSGIGKATERFYRDLLSGNDEALTPVVQSLGTENELLLLQQGKGRLYPGTNKVLRQFKRWGYRLGLVSNSNSRYFRGVIQAFGLSPLFDQTLCAGETDGLRKKELVKKVRDLLGAERIIVIGDRKEDILAAKDNGLQSIGCLYGYGSKEELETAHLKIKDLRELLSFFTS